MTVHCIDDLCGKCRCINHADERISDVERAPNLAAYAPPPLIRGHGVPHIATANKHAIAIPPTSAHSSMTIRSFTAKPHSRSWFVMLVKCIGPSGL